MESKGYNKIIIYQDDYDTAKVNEDAVLGAGSMF